jgi:hypothetical protein
VADGAGGARLLLEAPGQLEVAGQLAEQHLDRDLAAERQVAGHVDDAHAAARQLADDLELAVEDLTRREAVDELARDRAARPGLDGMLGRTMRTRPRPCTSEPKGR